MPQSAVRRCFFLAAAFFIMVCILKIPAAHRRSQMELTAHRGCSAQYPENTMAAFRAAADCGADCIELDVRETSDGVPVVSHDRNLRRVTGVSRNIETVSYQTLKTLDAGSWYDSTFSGERIPSLEEVLHLARKKRPLRLNIEIKPSNRNGTLGRDVVDLIRKYRLESRCVVASSCYGILRRVKQYAPEITTLYVVDDAAGGLSSLRCADEVSIAYPMLTAAAVAQLHACGKRVHVWTVDTAEQAQVASALDVDDMITDDPARIRAALQPP